MGDAGGGRGGSLAVGTDCAWNDLTMQHIAIQGEPGSNSHLVVRENHPDAQTVPCASFEEAFTRVTDGECELAVIPIDNSLAGRVADIHHLLPASGLHIVGEHFLRIRFSLLGLPGATLDGVRTVASHVHALGQCRHIIREHGWDTVVAGDTAGAAREVAEAGDPARAALAPPLAAEIHGLQVLAEGVEDAAHNTTRFVVLSREAVVPPRDAGPLVTTFVFTVRNHPAALYKALGAFATSGINMTKLESYMLDGRFTATMFLAEVDGHPEEPALAGALEELTFFTTDTRVLGTYPASPWRDGRH